MFKILGKLVFVVLGLAGVGLFGGSEAWALSDAEVKAANARAAKLIKLDDDARKQFVKEHPGVLPNIAAKLPKATAVSFDWCNLNKVSDAHRQLTGDCWANAALEALECSYLIRDNHRYNLSPQPILDHLKLGATQKKMGATPWKAYDYFQMTGTAKLESYSYNGKPQEPQNVALPYRAVAWGFVSQNHTRPSDEQVKEALLKHGPLAVDITDTKGFQKYTGGLYSEITIDKNNMLGRHSVLLVGWDDSRGPHGAWKIKNSWGPKWGEQGFMWIDRKSNEICRQVSWVRAASTHYSVSAEAFAQLVPNAKPLPLVKYKAPNAANSIASQAIVDSKGGPIPVANNQPKQPILVKSL
jgi:C1A family cysteine protease